MDECYGCRRPHSEGTGTSPEGYKLSPVSVLLGSPGASHSPCLRLQMWYGGDGMNFLEIHPVDWWKEKLPSVSAQHGKLFLHHMENCRWGREGEATSLSLLPSPLLIGLQGREEQVSEHWCEAMAVLLGLT